MTTGKRVAFPAAAVFLAAVLLACDSGSTDPDRLPLYRAVDVHGVSYRLLILSPAAQRQAEELLASGETRFAVGRPVRGAGYNAPWSWHLEPSSIRFETITAEACQTDATGVERDLEYWLTYPLGDVCIDARIVAREL